MKRKIKKQKMKKKNHLKSTFYYARYILLKKKKKSSDNRWERHKAKKNRSSSNNNRTNHNIKLKSRRQTGDRRQRFWTFIDMHENWKDTGHEMSSRRFITVQQGDSNNTIIIIGFRPTQQNLKISWLLARKQFDYCKLLRRLLNFTPDSGRFVAHLTDTKRWKCTSCEKIHWSENFTVTS